MEVHHINGNRGDNRFENLILLCLRHHTMADRREIDRPSVLEYKRLLSLPSNAAAIAHAMETAQPREPSLTIQILPARDLREGITRVEIVNLRDDKPLKIAAVRIIGLWEGGTEASLHDFPGLIWAEPLSVKDVEPDDSHVFIFPRSLGAVWFHDKKLKGFCAEVELRSKKKARSAIISRPAKRETEAMRNELLRTEIELKDVTKGILNGNPSDWALYDEIILRGQRGMGGLLPFVPTISETLIVDIRLTANIHHWREFSELAAYLSQLNLVAGDYNKNGANLDAAKTVLALAIQKIPELIERIRKLIVEFFP